MGLFESNLEKTLNANDIRKAEKEDLLFKIEGLQEEIIRMATTNSCKNSLASEQYQEFCDYRNHSEISVLIGVMMAYSHEVEGINGILIRWNNIRSAVADKQVEIHLEYEEFTKTLPIEHNIFMKNKGENQ